MTNKLVVIINSLKVPKIKKILLYEMKFLVPNYGCLHNPCLEGYCPQIPFLSVLCPQLNLLNPSRKIFLGTPLMGPACISFAFVSIPDYLHLQCPNIYSANECTFSEGVFYYIMLITNLFQSC